MHSKKGVVFYFCLLAIFLSRSALAAGNTPLGQIGTDFTQYFETELAKLGLRVPGQPPGLGATATGSIGIDYTPEARCADSNWAPFTTPVACNPQLSFSCNSNDLSGCPKTCQACYDADLANLQSTLRVGTITSYQPNYYILTTADRLKIKVLQGLYNDAIPSLAAPDSQGTCMYAGQSTPLCGSKYAMALLEGACGSTVPWDPKTFCNTSAYIEPLGGFINDGTIVGIQIGNEAWNTTVDNQLVTTQMLSTAAQVLKAALAAGSFKNVPMVVSLVNGQEQSVCTGTAPPANVDFIAAHPYCNFVSGVPPQWQFSGDGAGCWTQVQQLFADNAQKYCGAANTFIGETGYNSGCPNNPNVPASSLTDEQSFISSLKSSTCQSTPDNSFPTFLFAYADVCPESGCLAGCSGSTFTGGNGYFGVFHTSGYRTKGPIVQKFAPPSLTCSTTLLRLPLPRF